MLGGVLASLANLDGRNRTERACTYKKQWQSSHHPDIDTGASFLCWAAHSISMPKEDDRGWLPNQGSRDKDARVVHAVGIQRLLHSVKPRSGDL